MSGPIAEILEQVETGEITQAKVNEVAARPETRHALFNELSMWEPDLLPDHLNSIEDQAIAAFAYHFARENNKFDMPKAYSVIEKLHDAQDGGLFLVVEFADPRKDHEQRVGLVGPVGEADLPYREVYHAFAREGDTAQSISAEKLIEVWRDEYGAATSHLKYKYLSDSGDFDADALDD